MREPQIIYFSGYQILFRPKSLILAFSFHKKTGKHTFKKYGIMRLHYDLLPLAEKKSLHDYGLYQLNMMFFWALVMSVVKYVAHYIFLQKLPKFSIMSSLAVLILSTRGQKRFVNKKSGSF